MASVKDILAHMHGLSSAEQKLIEDAYAFAEKAHEGHTRYSGEPYFNHVFETAKGLAEIGMGPRTVAAGLLHDTVEDAQTPPEEIEKRFGSEVLFLVEGVTKLGTLKYRGVKRHTESLRKLFVATSQDIRVLIIKLMDRLHNMKTLQHVPERKQKRIAQETLEVYAPLADRLGIGRLKRELEDLSFPYVYPEEYEEMRRVMKERSESNEKRLEKISRSIQKELAQAGFRDFRTEWRIKGLYSLYKKLERKGGEIEKIHDIAAIRIIVPKVNDCYTVLGIVHSIWRPMPGKIKDYIAFHKPNGYQSLHTTLFMGDYGLVEIQIRTEEMHRNAQYGIASHLAYKSTAGTKDQRIQKLQQNRNTLWIRHIIPTLFRRFEEARDTRDGNTVPKPPGERARPPQWIRDIAEAQQDVTRSQEFLNSLKKDFFSHRVFVFTPKGDVIDLPIDSSPIDFAYHIHSDIGDHMAGAKVNGKMVTLNTKLKNGDIVEIETKKGARPTHKWLGYARTNLAKRHIRQQLAKAEEGAKS